MFSSIDYSIAKCCAGFFWQLVLAVTFKERIRDE